MKKTTLALAIAVASLTASAANAAYQNNTFYTGAKLGWSNFYHNQNEKVAGTYSVNKDNVAGGAFIGFQATPYLAAEIGYDWLGSVKYKSRHYRDSKTTVQGVSFTGKVSYPLDFITDDLDIYARAGAFVTIAKWQGQHGYGYGYDSRYSSTETSVSPTYALGLDYRLNEDFTTRLEYQYVQGIHNDGPARTDNGLLSLGITYRLGSPSVAPAPVEIKTQESRYVLNEDVLFAFAKHDLKPEGRQALDNLVSALVKINPTQSAIIVIGHTDPIGSDSYNLRLSDQRANAVMQYLISRGVPANLISARGVGKSQPLTGDKCNGLRGAELRACYAPDRRVEIEVKARNLQEVLVN